MRLPWFLLIRATKDDPPSSRDSPIAYRPATPAQVGRHSGSYFDAAGPWIPHLGHSFIGLKGGRSAHDQEHAFTIGSNLTENPLGSARLDQQFQPNYYKGLFGKPKRGITMPEDIDSNLISVHAPSVNPLNTANFIPVTSSTPSVSSVSQISSEAKQREFARGIFDQHGIRRPPGWFSDDEDLSLLGDRTAGHRRFRRICHVCSSQTWSRTHCPSCKHQLCAKCVCEVPESSEGAHAGFLHNPNHAARLGETRSIRPGIGTPRPGQLAQKIWESSITNDDGQSTGHTTRPHHQGKNDAGLQPEISGSEKRTQQPSGAATSPLSGRSDTLRDRPTRLVKQNSFIIADEQAREPIPESRIVEQSDIQESHYHKCPQRYTDDSCHEISSTKVECDDPMCRATHDGHHPYRHSITCALHRTEEADQCRGSDEGLIASDNASVARLPNPLSNRDTSQSFDHIIHRHYSTVFHHHVEGHLDSGTDHGSHELYTKHEIKSNDEARAPTATTLASPETSAIVGQGRKSKSLETKHVAHSSRRYEHSHGTMGGYAVDRGEAINRNPSSAIIRELGDTTQNKRPIPRGLVLSPPPWLKTPSKDAGDARSRLRRVVAETHGNVQGSRAASLRERVRHPKSPAYDRESQFHLIRTSAPSPLTALHITQHQRPGSWLHHSSEHVYLRASRKLSTHSARTLSASQCDHSPAVHREAPSHHRRRSAHLQDETVRPESRYTDNQENAHAISENERYPSSSMGRISHSPLQPRQILINVDESTTSERHTPALASDFEIHRPSPIVPPNHDCNWKDRYLALAAEIRLLKAELSTRASLAIRDDNYTREAGEDIANHDDDLGIEGVTIIMHLRGRDDLVINTDLTQEPD
ncbi:hypothetical protein F5Y13DRAFT_202535 [Hypoxylon sp. FL1857]|nr:hypothetical protein F5Y13DRAFT_202535 [Hypoxylon sp. FL1857]